MGCRGADLFSLLDSVVLMQRAAPARHRLVHLLLAPVWLFMRFFNLGKRLSKALRLQFSSAAPAKQPSGAADIQELLKRADDETQTSRPRANLGGGGSTDKYTWTQTSDEVEVRVPIAVGTTKRDVRVLFAADALAVRVGGAIVLEGRPCRALAPDDCGWQFEDAGGARWLTLALAKKSPTPVMPDKKCAFWECVLQGDDAVDVSHIGAEPRAIFDNARKDAVKADFFAKTGVNCDVVVS